MALLLENRLNLARYKRFVGRRAELELFEAALHAEASDFAVLHIYGPGGIGKTTLLREFSRMAQEANRLVLHLDGRNLDPSPAGWAVALQLALGIPAHESPAGALAAASDPVLLIDTYERMAALDSWLRQTFLPQLPERALVVIAGRDTPEGVWRADSGWGALTRIVALRNLRPEDSESYLLGRGVPVSEIDRLLDVTYGHPLALSLAADVVAQGDGAAMQTLQHDPNIVRLLLERFVADVPNLVHRRALEICAHALTTDEAMLADCLGATDAYHAFNWLRSLSFVEQGPFGLFPHDLAREALEADLRWRNFDRFRDLHHQVRTTIIRRAAHSTGLEQQYAIFSLIFLHRNNPIMRPFYEWQTLGTTFVDSLQPGDFEEVEAMVLRNQGPESLAITRYWQERQPASTYVFRSGEAEIAGFCQVVDMSALSAQDKAADPAMAAADAHLRTVPPLQPGEVVLHFRNWMHRDDYQMSPALFTLASTVNIRMILGTPKLAYTFVAQSDTPRYRKMFEYLRMALMPDAGYAADGQEFGVFVHDWRAEPPIPWLDVMGERELWDEAMPTDSPPQTVQPVVLSEPLFVSAVRQALKDVRRAELLVQSPLLQSRLLRDGRDGDPSPADLQALLREAAETLNASARDRKLFRSLWHTYFEPAPTQEAAAELLELPFSTYRYQLGKAIDRVVAQLWQRELYGFER